MPKIIIETTPEEQNAVIKAVKAHENEILSVRELSEAADLSASRTRYALVDLLEAGTIARKAHKAYNKHYVRYSYNLQQVTKDTKEE